jgi:hypothetical protein
MRSSLATLVFVAVTSAAGQAAADRAVRYVGVHPILTDHNGGGFCYIEFPHVHLSAPPARAEVMFRKHDDGLYFVGDPVPYGYAGPKQSYYGPHPVHVDFVLGSDGDHIEYCYLDGPHYHPFAPAPHASFKLEGGVYFHTGKLPRAYVDGRPRYGKINAVYKPMVYTRPVVVVAPPPEYHGPVVVEQPVVHAGVGVGVGAGVGVGVSAGISAGIHVGLPVVEVHHVHPAPHTVVVHEHHHHPRAIKVKHHKHKHKHKKAKRGRGGW